MYETILPSKLFWVYLPIYDKAIKMIFFFFNDDGTRSFFEKGDKEAVGGCHCILLTTFPFV